MFPAQQCCISEQEWIPGVDDDDVRAKCVYGLPENSTLLNETSDSLNAGTSCFGVVYYFSVENRWLDPPATVACDQLNVVAILKTRDDFDQPCNPRLRVEVVTSYPENLLHNLPFGV